MLEPEVSGPEGSAVAAMCLFDFPVSVLQLLEPKCRIWLS